MSKRQVLIILGIWVMILPFLGFPSSWKWIIMLISGALIVLIAYGLQPKARSQPNAGMPYVEQKNMPSMSSSPNRPSVPMNDITKPNSPSIQ